MGSNASILCVPDERSCDCARGKLDSEDITSLAVLGERQHSIDEVYVLGQNLGQGSFGRVASGRRRNSPRLSAPKQAIKVIERTPGNRQRFGDEITLMSEAAHPYIAKLHEVYDSGKEVFLVMEMCAGGSLAERVIRRQGLAEDTCAHVFRQVATAASFLHSRSIVHRDLKPENIVCCDAGCVAPGPHHVKLVDFGAARRFKPGQRMTSVVGTVPYMAPEVIGRSYTEACDAWALGILLYFLFCGFVPFLGEDDEGTTAQILGGYLAFPSSSWSQISLPPKTLIRNLATRNEGNRRCPRAALESRWLQERIGDDTSCEEQAVVEALGEEPQLIKRLDEFARASAIRRLIAYVVATQLEEKATHALAGIFLAADEDVDGIVTGRQLAAKMHEDVGSVGAGVLDAPMDFKHFAAAVLDPGYCSKDDVARDAFEFFDTAGKGEVSIWNILRLHGTVGVQRSSLLATLPEGALTADAELLCAMNLDSFKRLRGDPHAAGPLGGLDGMTPPTRAA